MITEESSNCEGYIYIFDYLLFIWLVCKSSLEVSLLFHQFHIDPRPVVFSHQRKYNHDFHTENEGPQIPIALQDSCTVKICDGQRIGINSQEILGIGTTSRFL